MESTFSSESLTASERVIKAIAEKEEVPPQEVPLLYDVIDPGALNQLLFSMNSEGNVTFQYDGYDVTVDSYERVTISGRDDD